MSAPNAAKTAGKSLYGYVIGTQMKDTVKVRVPREIHLPKYGKSIIRHRNYLAHDATGKCLVGDVVRIEETPKFTAQKSHAVAALLKKAERYVCPDTGYVYTDGHLVIPVGIQGKSEDGTECIERRLTREHYRQMGLL